MSSPTDPKLTALVAAGQWLSDFFSAAPSSRRVMQGAAPQEQEALRWIGEQLNAESTAQALCAALAQQAPGSLAVYLQRRYTALFEGIFRHRAVLPYESAWQGTGARPALGASSVSEMKAVLRALDVRVSADCPEPPDHIAIELAALVTALRDGQDDIAIDLLSRLSGWAPSFAAALNQQDQGGFYAAAGELLIALIDEAHAALKTAGTAAVFVTERRLGESV